MPKPNTLLNYFSSPKSDNRAVSQISNGKGSPASSKGEQKKKVPKTDKENSNTQNKSGTPKRKSKKEGTTSENRKRSSANDDEEEVKPKRRRLIVPSDNSDESGDEYKPDQTITESSESEEEVNESEASGSDVDSEEETPKKKAKTSRKPAQSKTNRQKTTKSETKAAQPSSQTSNGTAASTGNWAHLTFEFLKPDKIRDIHRRPLTDPNYDPKTLYVPEDFKDRQTPAMRQWWELKSKNFDCVLFFKVGKFYELYHMDAVIGVTELNFTYMRGEFAHSGFPEVAYSRFAGALVEKGYKVARIEQTENPEMMNARTSKMARATKFDKVVKREICQISSKGTRVFTAQDDSHGAVLESTYLLSIAEKYNPSTLTSVYGVCFIDTTIGDFHLGQFQDDRYSSRLLTLISHYPPVQVLYQRGGISERTTKILNTYLSTALHESLQRETQFWSASTTLKNLHEGEYFKSESVSSFSWPQGLQPYLSEGDSLGLTAREDGELAISALGGCIYHLKSYFLDQQLLAQGRFETYTPPDHTIQGASGNLPSTMVLDAVTINNLRVVGEASLFTTLDNCCTPFGKRLLREWICRPSCRKNDILRRQSAVTELIANSENTQHARGLLASLPDLERLLSKIHALGNFMKTVDHPDSRAIMYDTDKYSKRKILDFTSALQGFEKACEIMESFNEVKSDLLKCCTKQAPEGEFPELKTTLKYFKSAFDQEDAKKQGCIIPKKGVDSEYDAVLEELSELKEELNQYLARQRKHFGVKIEYFGSDKKRFQIEVPDSQLKKVSSNYELQSQRKGFKRYYTPETRAFLARQIQAEDTKNKILKDISRRIYAKFSEKYDMWCAAVYQLAVLDVLTSFAEYSQSGEMCIPLIEHVTDTQNAFIEIRDGRHPCITSDDFIPNDTLLATEGSASLVILTGPNMGGKSTLMRQVGLLTIMAQIGCHVPASMCRLTLADRIFTRLGANDDIMTGQSTFLVELSETATILQHATPNSLVLLDELGRGTSTYDGTAIAAAVVSALKNLKCRTLFSTHYHSLVEDYKSDESISLAHMACMVETEEEEDVSQETVTFLYKLSAGACPKSYGFNAARLAGIPSTITKNAHEIARRLEAEVNQKHCFIALCKGNGNIKNLIATLK